MSSPSSRPGFLPNLQKLYLNKLQTSFIYDAAARNLKSFSEAVYERLALFGEQDRNHAVHLHGFLVDKHATQQTLIIPYLILGIGQKDTDGEEDAIGTACAWLDSLSSFEKNVEDCIREINEEGSEFIEQATDYIRLDGLQSIASDRIAMLHDLKVRIRAEKLYSRENGETPWRCVYCGHIEHGKNAPESCFCCNQEGHWQKAGTWRVP